MSGHVIFPIVRAEGGHVMACYLPHCGGEGEDMSWHVIFPHCRGEGEDMSWHVIFPIVREREDMSWHVIFPHCRGEGEDMAWHVIFPKLDILWWCGVHLGNIMVLGRVKGGKGGKL